MTKNCIQCKKEFSKKYKESFGSFSSKKYCSTKCYSDSGTRPNMFKKGHTTNIGHKHTEISKIKMSNSQIGIKRSLETREKLSNAHKGVKLSEEHKLALRLAKKKGIESHNWIKDRSLVIGRHNRNMHDPDYKYWRKQVCDRDNWSCRIADNNCEGKLEVHHILSWSNFPELRYEVNNGITLCHFHHPRKRNDEMKLSPFFQELVKTNQVSAYR